MALTALPSSTHIAGDTGHATDHNAVTKNLAALIARGVPLDAFTDTGDDAKLAAAMSYAAAQTIPPPILVGGRPYTLSNGYDLYDGFALLGIPARGNAELSTHAGGVKTPVTMNVSGTAFDCSGGGAYNSGYVVDVSIRNIQFQGGSSTVFISGGTTGAVHSSELRDLGFSGFKTVLGTQAQPLGLTTCYVDGFDVNNCYNGAISVKGSDNVLFTGHCNIDSPTSALSLYSATGQYHVTFSYLDKSVVGPMYITCEGGWGGLYVNGPAYNSGNSVNGGPVWVSGAKIEGRNKGAACDGANVKVDGGILVLRDSWVSFGMVSPSSMGHTPTDAGMIHQTGGFILAEGCCYDRATGVAESTPWLYQNGSGAVARVSNMMHGSQGGVWTGLPQVHSAAGSLNADNSVSVV